jgi:serine protease Do
MRLSRIKPLLLVAFFAATLNARFAPAAFQMAGDAQQAGAGYLGIRLGEIDADRASALKLTEERGVEIKYVQEGGPADRAGLHPGDVLLAYNGETILGAQQFIRLVRETPAGRHVKLQVWRSGKQQVVMITVGSAPTSILTAFPGFDPFPDRPAAFMIEVPDTMVIWKNLVFGAEIESLDVQLAQYFGVKGGVLVRSVMKSLPAEKAGVRAGDVIVAVDEHAIATPHDISSYLRTMREGGKSISLSVVRDHKQRTVQLILQDIQR